MPAVTLAPLGKIREDGCAQSRAGLDPANLLRLTEKLESQGELDPVELVHDGKWYWPWDGLHRIHVYREAKRTSILALVRQGTKRDAELLSFGANERHGLGRSGEDRLRAVRRMLADLEWGQWSTLSIAKAVGWNTGHGRAVIAQMKAEGDGEEGEKAACTGNPPEVVNAYSLSREEFDRMSDPEKLEFVQKVEEEGEAQRAQEVAEAEKTAQNSPLRVVLHLPRALHGRVEEAARAEDLKVEAWIVGRLTEGFP